MRTASSRLAWTLDTKDDVAYVGLRGEITEESDFGALAALEAPTCVLDLAEVTRINSCGVREWIRFLGKLARDGRHVALERCSVAVVQQLNTITTFRGGAEVRSIFAAYVCRTCDSEHRELIDLARPDCTVPETAPCPQCGASAAFDDIAEAYLAFLG